MSRFKLHAAIAALGALALVLGVGAYLKTASAGRAQRQQVVTSDKTANAGDNVQLLEKLAELSAQVQSLQAKVRESNNQAPSVAVSSESSASADPPKSRAEERQDRADQIAEIEAQFHQERPDPNWARATSATLQQGMTELPAIRAALRNVDCRARSCRVEFSPEQSAEFARDFPIFVHQLASVLPTAQFDQVDTGNGKKALIAYLSRDPDPSIAAPSLVE